VSLKADDRLSSLPARLGSKRQVKHAVAAVESGDGSFRWAGARGHADVNGTSMRVDIPFHIASIDKLHTACLVMKLVEGGRLACDAPVSRCLPQDTIAGLHRIDGIDRTGQITVRHLLGHTSGLPDCFEEAPRGERSLMERLFTEGDFTWTLEDLLRIVRDGL
jgi:D-alanyl-D-alanine carboxypeptidase